MHAFLVICPIGGAKVSLAVGHDDHLADGSVDSIDQ
jgi:hypothetical protein